MRIDAKLGHFFHKYKTYDRSFPETLADSYGVLYCIYAIIILCCDANFQTIHIFPPWPSNSRTMKMISNTFNFTQMKLDYIPSYFADPYICPKKENGENPFE